MDRPGIITVRDGDDDSSEIVLAGEGGDSEVIARTDGLVSFVADPAGERLAVFSLLPGDPDAVSAALIQEKLESNTLSIVDLDDGTVTEVTREPVAVFMWSPDGEKLLVMGAGSAPGRVRWSVWTEEDGLVEGPEFAPSPHWVEDYLPFHDQYARSMTLWSPDSGSFAFPGEIDDREGIWPVTTSRAARAPSSPRVPGWSGPRCESVGPCAAADWHHLYSTRPATDHGSTPWGRGEAWSSRRACQPEVAGSNPVAPAHSLRRGSPPNPVR